MKRRSFVKKSAIVTGGLFLTGNAFSQSTFFKKKKTVSMTLDKPFTPILPILPIKIIPIKSIYPSGVFEGMRAVGIDTQYLIKNGKKYSITYDQWQKRGFDPGTPVEQFILNTIPDGENLNDI